MKLSQMCRLSPLLMLMDGTNLCMSKRFLFFSFLPEYGKEKKTTHIEVKNRAKLFFLFSIFCDLY
jgi:hypothetical protein